MDEPVKNLDEALSKYGLTGVALEDIKCGDRIEYDCVSGHVRVIRDPEEIVTITKLKLSHALANRVIFKTYSNDGASNSLEQIYKELGFISNG